MYIKLILIHHGKLAHNEIVCNRNALSKGVKAVALVIEAHTCGNTGIKMLSCHINPFKKVYIKVKKDS